MPGFPTVSARVDRIFKTYYSAVCEEKVDQYYDGAVKAAKGARFGAKFHPHIDKGRVQDFAYSYFLDVIKYKEYHFTPKVKTGELMPDPYSEQYMEAVHKENPDPALDKAINLPKVAAFTAKWWLRHQPIIILTKVGYTPTEKEFTKQSLINETFIQDICLREILKIKLTDVANRDLLYHLKYRNLDDRGLMLAFSVGMNK